MNISVTLDTSTVKRMLERMTPEVGELAVKRTINKVADQARTRMSREIRAEFNLSKAKVDEKLHTRIARSEGRLRFTGQLLSYGPQGRRAINLINFAARQTKKGLTFKIRKQGGRGRLDRAFVGNKGRTVFERVGKERLPIKAVQTIDVPQMFNARRIKPKITAFVEQKFLEVFVREARYAMRQVGAA